jgi:hypothetical protein
MPTIRHLRARGEGIAQPTTTVELFFDPSARPRSRSFAPQRP